MKTILALSVFVVCSYGESGPASVIAQPVLGWSAQSAPPEIRPVLGASSAARLGEPIALPEGVKRLFIAPGERYALLERAGNWIVLNLRTSAVRDLTIGSTPADPVFSPNGRTVLMRTGDSTAEIRTGLPEESAMRRVLTVPSGATHLAVSDDGDVAYASGDGTFLDTGAGLSTVARASSIALAFGANNFYALFPSGDLQTNGETIASLGPIDGPATLLTIGGAKPVVLVTTGTTAHVIDLQTGTHSAADVAIPTIGLRRGTSDRLAVSSRGVGFEAPLFLSLAGAKLETFTVPAARPQEVTQ